MNTENNMSENSDTVNKNPIINGDMEYFVCDTDCFCQYDINFRKTYLLCINNPNNLKLVLKHTENLLIYMYECLLKDFPLSYDVDHNYDSFNNKKINETLLKKIYFENNKNYQNLMYINSCVITELFDVLIFLQNTEWIEISWDNFVSMFSQLLVIYGKYKSYNSMYEKFKFFFEESSDSDKNICDNTYNEFKSHDNKLSQAHKLISNYL